jgi:hypothetical protein
MASKKSLGALVVAISLPTLLLAVSGGVANASNVSATIETHSGCQWQLSSVPNQVDLVPVTFSSTEAIPSGAKYVGEQLWLAGIWPAMSLALIGEYNSDIGINNQTTDCSFYNEMTLQYPVVKAGLNQAKTDWMDAHYLDSAGDEQTDSLLSFQLKPGNPLVIHPYSPALSALALGLPSPAPTANDLQCINSRIGGAKSLSRGLDVSYPTQAYTNKMILWVTGVANKYESAAAPKCVIDTLFMLHIPAISAVPASPGSNYVFKGPEVIFTLTTQGTVPVTPVNPSVNTDYSAYTVDSLLGAGN